MIPDRTDDTFSSDAIAFEKTVSARQDWISAKTASQHFP
jgi:hypothetical protein